MNLDTQLDLSRWTEAPRGVGYRRWVMVSTGLRQLLRGRFFRLLVILGWAAGVFIAAFGFVFTQSIATGGWVESFAANFGPRGEAIASAFTGLVLLYPDIIVGGMFTLVFWMHSSIGLGLSLVALTVVIPRLVARDRASNALTIYLSRPLRSIDYLLGKLGIVAGILLLLWTGPLLFGWLLSMLFAPNTDFLVYSMEPLVRASVFNILALIVLSSIALGISALNRTSRNTIVMWIGMWIVVGTFAKLPFTPGWLRCVSFSRDLDVARQAIFRVDQSLVAAGNSLSFVSQELTHNLAEASRHLQASNTTSAFIGLALLVLVSCAVFFRKLRAE